jgi:hypothetical protein
MRLGLRTRICPRNTVWRCIVGNTSLPQLKPAFRGDVICFRVFNQVVVVLCSLPAIKDLFEKRAESYSDRPTLPILEMYTLCHYDLQSSAMIITHYL